MCVYLFNVYLYVRVYMCVCVCVCVCVCYCTRALSAVCMRQCAQHRTVCAQVSDTSKITNRCIIPRAEIALQRALSDMSSHLTADVSDTVHDCGVQCACESSSEGQPNSGASTADDQCDAVKDDARCKDLPHHQMTSVCRCSGDGQECGHCKQELW